MTDYIDKVGNRRYAFPYIRITTTPVEVQLAGGKTKWSANFKSYGPWVEAA